MKQAFITHTHTQEMKTMNTTTYVISRVEAGNWQVEDNAGNITDGFSNWTAADAFVRPLAVASGAAVIRLSATDSRVVSHLVPRATIPAALRRQTGGDEIVEPASTIDFVDDLVAEETNTVDLNTLSTVELVALYNANGGNITGRYKGSRAALIAKIQSV